MRASRDFTDSFLCELDQLLVEQDGLDVPDPCPLDVDVLILRDPPRRRFGIAQHLSELHSIEMTLIEQALCRLDNRGDDARLRDDAAYRAHGPTSGPPRDLADPALELR